MGHRLGQGLGKVKNSLYESRGEEGDTRGNLRLKKKETGYGMRARTRKGDRGEGGRGRGDSGKFFATVLSGREGPQQPRSRALEQTRITRIVVRAE